MAVSSVHPKINGTQLPSFPFAFTLKLKELGLVQPKTIGSQEPSSVLALGS